MLDKLVSRKSSPYTIVPLVSGVAIGAIAPYAAAQVTSHREIITPLTTEVSVDKGKDTKKVRKEATDKIRKKSPDLAKKVDDSETKYTSLDQLATNLNTEIKILNENYDALVTKVERLENNVGSLTSEQKFALDTLVAALQGPYANKTSLEADARAACNSAQNVLTGYQNIRIEGAALLKEIAEDKGEGEKAITQEEKGAMILSLLDTEREAAELLAQGLKGCSIATEVVNAYQQELSKLVENNLLETEEAKLARVDQGIDNAFDATLSLGAAAYIDSDEIVTPATLQAAIAYGGKTKLGLGVGVLGLDGFNSTDKHDPKEGVNELAPGFTEKYLLKQIVGERFDPRFSVSMQAYHRVIDSLDSGVQVGLIWGSKETTKTRTRTSEEHFNGQVLDNFSNTDVREDQGTGYIAQVEVLVRGYLTENLALEFRAGAAKRLDKTSRDNFSPVLGAALLYRK